MAAPRSVVARRAAPSRRSDDAYPRLFVSERFRRAYPASPRLQGAVDATIQQLVSLMAAEPHTWRARHKTLAHLPQVAELHVEGADNWPGRLLATWREGGLVLLDLGGHETPGRYRKAWLGQDITSRQPAPASFYPPRADEVRFFARNPCRDAELRPEELRREWLYFLSRHQADVAEQIRLRAFEAVLDRRPGLIFLLGGPGTGKTSVLLSLLKTLTDDGVVTRIAMSDPLARYVDAVIPEAEIERFRAPRYTFGALGVEGVAAPTGSGADVVLVDDPDYYEINAWRRSFGETGAKLAVLAFDPCQLTQDFLDDELDEWAVEDIEVVALNECYRQRAEIGWHIKKVIDRVAASTPFLDKGKIARFCAERERLTSLANEITFPNPHGYLELYHPAKPADVRSEVARLREQPLWRHWPPLLVAVADGLELTRAEEAALRPVASQRVALSRLHDIKGLEFQHAFLFLDGELYEQLERGFRGSGQRLYHQRRLLRIPFSRAKDSLVTFVR